MKRVCRPAAQRAGACIACATPGQREQHGRRAPEDGPQLRAQLTAEFAPQVAELGALIGRDLSAWSSLASPATRLVDA